MSKTIFLVDSNTNEIDYVFNGDLESLTKAINYMHDEREKDNNKYLSDIELIIEYLEANQNCYSLSKYKDYISIYY